MLLLLSTAVFAQQQVNSLQPLLQVQGEVIDLLEGKNFLITDMTVGMVFDGTDGHKVPIELRKGETVLFVAVGDDQRIADLDLYVFDGRNMLAWEDEADSEPVLEFTAPADGVYEVRAAVAEARDGWNGGFFALTTAIPITQTPITVKDTFELFQVAVETMEANDLQVIHGEFEVLEKKRAKAVPIYVADWSTCMAVAVADPNRNKKLDLAVLDPYGSQLASDKKNGQLGLVNFMPGPGGDFGFIMNARKMRRGYKDTHAMVVVGCLE